MAKLMMNIIQLMAIIICCFCNLCLAEVMETCIPQDSNNSIAIKFADVDNDGDLDIIVANLRQQNRIYININGKGKFQDETASRFPQEHWPSVDIDVGDVNGDGFVDIIVANTGTEGAQNRLLINDGKGFFKDETFKNGQPYRLPAIKDNSRGVKFVDVDNDGDLDIVVANVAFPLTCTGQQNRILINDGKGFFREETSLRFPVDKNSSRAVAVGDLDGDGDMDIVLANRVDTRCYSSPQNRVWLNKGNGFFVDQTEVRFPVDSDSTRCLDIGDVDNDGDLDIIFGNALGSHTFSGGGQQNRLLINNGRGFFTDETSVRLPSYAKLTKKILFLDVDNDGDLDIFEANSRHENGSQSPLPGQQNRLLINDGKGFFRDESIQGIGKSWRLPYRIDNSYGADFGDVNGDGFLDIVVANRREQNVLLINDGKGFFSLAPVCSP